jgi:hypothetical protein
MKTDLANIESMTRGRDQDYKDGHKQVETMVSMVASLRLRQTYHFVLMH